jgi:dTMP kinase
MFIVFDGIDGSGKSKQAELFYNSLKAKKVRCVLTREPTQSPIGMVIMKILEEDMEFDSYSFQLLFSADRAYHVNTLIKPTIENDTTVVSDRYYLSTIAFGMAAGLDKRWLTEMNSKFPEPDMTFIMDIDPKVAMERVHSRAAHFIEKTIEVGHSDAVADKKDRTPDELFEKVEFLAKTRKAYIELAAERKNVQLIDASKGIKEISEEIQRRVAKIMI